MGVRTPSPLKSMADLVRQTQAYFHHFTPEMLNLGAMAELAN